MWIRSVIFTSLVTLLVSCGSGSSATSGSGSNSVGGDGASSSASLTVNFPLAGSLSTEESISFTGQVADLASGANAQVRVHSGGEMYSATVDASSRWYIQDVALTETPNGSYSVDLYIDGIMVDSDTLALGFHGTMVSFGLGDALALDEDAREAYLVDDRRLIQVDLVGGQRFEIALLPLQVQRISDLFWHPPTQRLYLFDHDGDVLAYEQKAGAWQLAELSQALSAATADSANEGRDVFLYNSESQVLNRYNEDFQWVAQVLPAELSDDVKKMVALGESQLVLVGSTELAVINPDTDETQIFSIAELGLGTVGDVTIDSVSEQLYIRNASNNELRRVQLDLSDSGQVSSELLDLGGRAAYTIEFDETGGELLFSATNALFALDPNDLSVAVLSELNWGSGADWAAPSSIALSENGEQLYVSDLANDDIYELNLFNGNRQALDTSGDSLEAVLGMVQDGENLYSVDLVRRSVLTTEIESGVTTDLALIGPGDPTLSEPIAIDLDEDRFRAFVLDRGLRAICEVNTASGVASILASSDDANALTLANSLVFEEVTQSIYWSSWFDNSLHRLNLNTLESELISGFTLGEGPNFQRPGAVALNQNATVAYVTDVVDGRVFAVNLLSGDRHLVLEAGRLLNPDSMVYDSERRLLQVLDTATGGVYALEPNSGDLALIAL